MTTTHRRWLALAVAGLLLLAGGARAAGTAADADDERDFQTARGLFWSGQYEQAEPMFKMYLLKHPDHKPSQAFMQMIAQARTRNPSKIGETRKRLEEIVLDEVKFDNADWQEVSDFLKEKANPTKDGKEPEKYVNFINLIPPSLTVKVTLNLRKVSVLRALHHACAVADLRYVVDSWAVIVSLPERAPSK
jgi:Spy/CpxP family protein refolding chaperone